MSRFSKAELMKFELLKHPRTNPKELKRLEDIRYQFVSKEE